MWSLNISEQLTQLKSECGETLQEWLVWFQSVSVARLLALASVEDATHKLKTLGFPFWFALLLSCSFLKLKK